MRYVLIIAGGSGTRLWPLSRQGAPKQLLDLFQTFGELATISIPAHLEAVKARGCSVRGR